ncbi:MAG: sigma-70 family RNA polymerase sigma factor [Candidatus Peregrinibacteria bacterium]|nr:sigma-70 family RNA polymerase sigma factor [Candidatus Peregrinibacteria bacterium]
MKPPKPSNPNREKPDENKVQKLVAACQNGDVDAFGTLYDLYIDAIYRYVYYRVDKTEVEDIVENVFIKTWENIDKYKPADCPFSAWLFRIGHNLVVDHYRFHRKHISLRERLPKHLNQSSDDPMDFADQKLNQRYLREALVELNEPYQQVLVLRFLNGFSNPEIAKIMDRKVGNIRILQYRALKELREILKRRGIYRND